MTTEQHFQAGDRVRTIYAVGGIRPGARGTVVRTFPFTPVYDITFDGDDLPHLVMGYKMVPDLPERHGR